MPKDSALSSQNLVSQPASAFAAERKPPLSSCRPKHHAFHRRFRACGRRFSFGLVFMTLIPIPVLTATASSQIPDPVQFVFTFNHDVFAQLNLTTIDAVERKRRFAALVDSGLDLDAISENLLGWRWLRATIADRQTFRQEFRGYLIQKFAMRVIGLDDGHMTITGVVEDENTVLVLSEITTKQPAPQAFAWRVVYTQAGWRLCDVVVNNVSVASIMRSQFDSVLQDAGPDIGPLLRLLHAKSEE
jgi:phospholipid transport system substrate-binding protein